MLQGYCLHGLKVGPAVRKPGAGSASSYWGVEEGVADQSWLGVCTSITWWVFGGGRVGCSVRRMWRLTTGAVENWSLLRASLISVRRSAVIYEIPSYYSFRVAQSRYSLISWKRCSPSNLTLRMWESLGKAERWNDARPSQSRVGCSVEKLRFL